MVIWYFELPNFDAIHAIASTDFFINHPLCFLVSLRRIPDSEQCLINFRTNCPVRHPICRNHFLLVPRGGEQPQVLTLDALMMGLAFALRSSRRLWVSFNTIGAGASVNHLHLHGAWADMEQETTNVLHTPTFEVLYIHGRFATKTARAKCNGFGKSKEFVVLQTCIPCVGLRAYLVNQLVWGHRVDLCSLSRGEMELQHVARTSTVVTSPICSAGEWLAHIVHMHGPMLGLTHFWPILAQIKNFDSFWKTCKNTGF